MTNKPVCIITGASGDFGSEIARKLSASYSLSLIGRTNTSLQKVLLCLEEGNHQIYPCDITRGEQIEDVIATIIDNQGNPSVLINCAAAFGDPKKIDQYSDLEIDEVIGTNLVGTIKLTKGVLPLMIQNGGGKIFTLGSTSGFDPYPLRNPYGVSKGGLAPFVWGNAIDYSKQGIDFYYVCPGPTEGARVNDIIEKRVTATGKDFGKMRQNYGNINGGELLKVSDTVTAIEMILNGDLSIPSGATLCVDNYGIYDGSHPTFSSDNYEEHVFIKGKKRKYLVLRSELSPVLEKNKTKTVRMELFRNFLSHTSKWAAILLMFFLIGKTLKFDQKIESGIYDFRKYAFHVVDFEHEFKRIAREKYGINNPQDLIENANALQDWELTNLYTKIGQEALGIVKIDNAAGYKIKGTALDNIDI